MRLSRPPIVAVAVRFRGKIYSLPAPNRHHHVLRVIAEETGEAQIDVDQDDQGFLDAEGTYLRRPQAEVNAEIHKQIKGGKIIGGVLTSEDLW